MFESVPLVMMMASKIQAGTHFPQPLQRENSTYTGSPGSILTRARVLHARRASQGSQPWQISQLISGLNKISS
jgi:hypothetical protein